MAKIVKRCSKQYAVALSAFGKQFKNIDKITRIYINDANKVYAAEWIDKDGIINFNAGYAPDVHKTIIFED